jgi:hypothetical protein
MGVTNRARSVARTGLKVQRRIVIAQALWWPTLILTAVGTAALVVVKHRRANPQPRPEPVLAAPPAPA